MFKFWSASSPKDPNILQTLDANSDHCWPISSLVTSTTSCYECAGWPKLVARDKRPQICYGKNTVLKWDRNLLCDDDRCCRSTGPCFTSSPSRPSFIFTEACTVNNIGSYTRSILHGQGVTIQIYPDPSPPALCCFCKLHYRKITRW